MACYKGTRNGEEVTLSFWGLVVYRNGLIDLLELSETKGCLFLFLGVWFPLNLEPVVELAQLVKSHEILSVRMYD